MSSDHGNVHIRTRHDLFPVELLDHEFRRVVRGYGHLNAEVAPGIYMKRCETGGPGVERLVKVAGGETVDVPFTDEGIYTQPSAAPVPGSISRHEFYTEPSHDLTQQPDADFNHGSGARLTLFATQLDFAQNPDWDKGARPVNWKGARLRDARGNALCELLGDEARKEEDRKRGSAGFCADLEPGGYFLEWPRETTEGRTVLQPLWLAQGWVTRLFAGANDEDPLPQRETASIHMLRFGSPIPTYDLETDRANGAAELALASLRTGRRQLADELLRTLLYGKFENPMLGLLGAHMLLQRSQLNRPLFDEVYANLELMLGPHPDLLALAVLARSRFEDASLATPTEVDFPPMLRDGLMALDAAQWDEKRPLTLTATTNLARLRLLAEGPWTFFWHAQAEPQAPQVPTSLPKLFRSSADALLPGDAPASSASFPGELHGFRPDVIEQHGSLEGFENAPAEAKTATLREVADYLRHLQERRGAVALHSLRSEDLRWSGLSPADARAALNAIQITLRVPV